MNTFIDPRQQGGRLNARTTEPLVERLTLDGEDWLRYRAIPITAAFIRATSADPRGNLTVEREGVIGDILPLAQAAKNHGGVVIAQVERMVERITDPKAVRVPGVLVDYITLAEKADHAQTFAEEYNEAYTTTANGPVALPMAPFSERMIVGRRALAEIRPGEIVNLGIGLPESVAWAAAESGRFGDFTLTVESGPTGGVPASGLSFGCSHYPEAVIDQPAQFDYYDGGGLDIAVLGAVEIDGEGSVNVSTFRGCFAGVGGFVNIAQSARRVVFCCTFTAGELEVAVREGRLQIAREGKHRKFVSNVQQVCFHGPTALARGQEVLYVTERAVFALTPRGLELREVAPGIDIASDIVPLMDFAPVVGQVTEMPARCFVG